MSTSLKVVSIAAVFCASFSRAAMVRRRRVILHPLLARLVVRAAALAAGARRGAGAGRLRNASTSPLVMRPSLPVPAPICAGDSCCSSISLAAAGSGACAGARRAGRARHRAERTRRRMHAGRRVGGRPRRCGRRGDGLRRQPALRARTAHPRRPPAWPAARRPATSAALRRGDRSQHAGGRRGDLHRHLVGLQLDQRLVGRDRVAVVLHPARDGGGGDAFAQRGHLDLGRHRRSSAFVLSRCPAPRRPGSPARAHARAARPVAGLAAASRPT